MHAQRRRLRCASSARLCPNHIQHAAPWLGARLCMLGALRRGAWWCRSCAPSVERVELRSCSLRFSRRRRRGQVVIWMYVEVGFVPKARVAALVLYESFSVDSGNLQANDARSWISAWVVGAMLREAASNVLSSEPASFGRCCVSRNSRRVFLVSTKPRVCE